MQGIDISNYQRGIDLDKVPFDFMICKATEGTGIVHDTCDGFVQKAKALGKKWGFYHFLNGEDPVKQAEFFVSQTKNYFGNGVPALDYEMYGMVHGAAGAKKFLDRVHELTGIRCAVYMSRSVCTEDNWSAVAKDHPLWVAQYANTERTSYQATPWLPSGGFGAWDECALHQYSSNGRLDGYAGPLDLDIAHLDADGWDRVANPKGLPVPDAKPSGTVPQPQETALELAARRHGRHLRQRRRAQGGARGPLRRGAGVGELRPEDGGHGAGRRGNPWGSSAAASFASACSAAATPRCREWSTTASGRRPRRPTRSRAATRSRASPPSTAQTTGRWPRRTGWRTRT